MDTDFIGGCKLNCHININTLYMRYCVKVAYVVGHIYLNIPTDVGHNGLLMTGALSLFDGHMYKQSDIFSLLRYTQVHIYCLDI
jgi:hypothetical protein